MIAPVPLYVDSNFQRILVLGRQGQAAVPTSSKGAGGQGQATVPTRPEDSCHLRMALLKGRLVLLLLQNKATASQIT